MPRTIGYQQSRKKIFPGIVLMVFSTSIYMYMYLQSLTTTRKNEKYSIQEVPEKDTASIIFVETSRKPLLHLRTACSIESAAHHNPQIDIRVFSLAPFDTREGHMKALSIIPNIELKVMNLSKVFGGTPLNNLFLSGELNHSSYPIHHTSDAARLALLWRLGGIYLDTDTITLRSLDGLQNALGLQYPEDVASGVLFFQKNSRFLQICMTHFAADYQKTKWSYQGPVLVTKILKETCNVTKLAVVINKPESCHGIRLLPEHDLLPIAWNDRDLFLTEKDWNKIDLNKSYMVHLYGAALNDTPVKPGSGVLLDTLAKENCPLTYKWMLINDGI